MRTASSLAALPLAGKLRYYKALWQMHGAPGGPTAVQLAAALAARFRDYDGLCRAVSGTPLGERRVLEVGFGARPLFLAYLSAVGVYAAGIDLDAPLLDGSVRELARIARRNGMARALKSAARYLAFSRPEWRALARELGVERRRLFPARAMVVGPAQDPRTWAPLAGVDWGFVYSKCVFEHIPREHLDAVCRNIAAHAAADAVVLIEPCLFTGLSGGHLPEWYPHLAARDMARDSEPWEHLRRRRFSSDAFLNEVRLHEYRALFARHFEIVAETERFPGLAERYLTDAVRRELAAYGREELLANTVRFVLRPRRPRGPAVGVG